MITYFQLFNGWLTNKTIDKQKDSRMQTTHLFGKINLMGTTNPSKLSNEACRNWVDSTPEIGFCKKLFR